MTKTIAPQIFRLTQKFSIIELDIKNLGLVNLVWEINTMKSIDAVPLHQAEGSLITARHQFDDSIGV